MGSDDRGRGPRTMRGLRVLALLLLLPIATTLALPAAGMAKVPRTGGASPAGGVDTLWVGDRPGTSVSGATFSVCAGPTSQASIDTCFATWTFFSELQNRQAWATDGTDVYATGSIGGGYFAVERCPVAGLGTGCARAIRLSAESDAIAAYAGTYWYGQNAGRIYRCDSTDTCVLLDDAVDRPVKSLFYANGVLYAGLGGTSKQQGILWKCDPDTANQCTNLDTYGNTFASSFSAGGGYLWALLTNGILWRCDPVTVNDCADWGTPGSGQVTSDGAGTNYVASWQGILACPQVATGTCTTTAITSVANSVAAWNGSFFAAMGKYPPSLYTGGTPYAYDGTHWAYANLLYLPAGGPVGVGGARMTISAPELTARMEHRCARSETTPRARIRIVGPNGMRKVTHFRVCRLRGDGVYRVLHDLLDPGLYTVRIRSGRHRGQASFTVEPDTTKRVSVAIAPAR